MKHLFILIAALILIGCDETSNTVQTPVIQDSDIPCALGKVPIYIGQARSENSINIYPQSGGAVITFDLTNIPAGVDIVHILASPVALQGNLAPGQFPIHIENPEHRQYSFTAEQLGIDPGCQWYFYVHFEIGNETAWAGTQPNSGRGQWYYLSYLYCCN